MPIDTILKLLTNKFIYIPLLCLAALLGGYLLNNYLSQKTTISVTGGLMAYAPADKIFTSYIHMPVARYKYSEVQTKVRDWFKIKYSKRNFLTGYCLRRYDVGLGYDDIGALLKNASLLKNVCQKDETQNYATYDEEQLPEPEILSLNAVSSRSDGDYSRIECDTLDLVTYEEEESRAKPGPPKKGEPPVKAIIQDILQQQHSEHWKQITKNSRTLLVGYLRLYCRENP